MAHALEQKKPEQCSKPRNVIHSILLWLVENGILADSQFMDREN
jgi:hypothetical protein